MSSVRIVFSLCVCQDIPNVISVRDTQFSEIAYQREIDNEWIVLDWSYWVKDSPLAEREPMSEDLKYIDDYFFVQATKTVETPYSNRVRFAAISSSFFLNTTA